MSTKADQVHSRPRCGVWYDVHHAVSSICDTGVRHSTNQDQLAMPTHFVLTRFNVALRSDSSIPSDAWHRSRLELFRRIRVTAVVARENRCDSHLAASPRIGALGRPGAGVRTEAVAESPDTRIPRTIPCAKSGV